METSYSTFRTFFPTVPMIEYYEEDYDDPREKQLYVWKVRQHVLRVTLPSRTDEGSEVSTENATTRRIGADVRSAAGHLLSVGGLEGGQYALTVQTIAEGELDRIIKLLSDMGYVIDKVEETSRVTGAGVQTA